MASKKKPSAPPKTALAKRAKKAHIKDAVMRMLVKGITLDELVRKLEWQKHSVRGLISNLAKAGAQIQSEKTEAGRFYRLAS